MIPSMLNRHDSRATSSGHRGLHAISYLIKVPTRLIRRIREVGLGGRVFQASAGMAVISLLKLCAGIDPLASMIVLIYLGTKRDKTLPTTLLAISLTTAADAVRVVYRGVTTVCYKKHANKMHECHKRLYTVDNEQLITQDPCNGYLLGFSIDNDEPWQNRSGPFLLYGYNDQGYTVAGTKLFLADDKAYTGIPEPALYFMGDSSFCKGGNQDCVYEPVFNTSERLCPPLEDIISEEMRCVCTKLYPEATTAVPTNKNALLTTVGAYASQVALGVGRESIYLVVIGLLSVLVLGLLVKILYDRFTKKHHYIAPPLVQTRQQLIPDPQ